MAKQHIEICNVELENGQTEVWHIPFKWYKEGSIRCYKPTRKIEPFLTCLNSWERVSTESPAF